MRRAAQYLVATNVVFGALFFAGCETVPQGIQQAIVEMVQQIAVQVLNIISDCERVTIFRELSTERKLESVIAGILLGLMCEAMVRARDPASMDYLETYIARSVPLARTMAEVLRASPAGLQQIWERAQS